MAIATFPNSIKPTTMNVTSETQTVVTHSQSFARQARTRGGQRWKIEYVYPTMTRSEIAPLLGFIQSRGGQAGEFTIDPAGSLFSNTGDTKLASGISPATSYVSTPAGGGIVVGRTTGNTAFSSSTDNIEAGTFIKFSNHSKVYMTTQALELSGSGSFFHEATIEVLSSRDTVSPKLDGNLIVTLAEVDATGTADDSAETAVTVATLASDSAAQIATKIATAVDLIAGFSATATDTSVVVSVERKTGGSTTANGRKVLVVDMISNINRGITGIRTNVDNFTTIGGSDPATLYFDPPLREAIDTTTTIEVAPLDSVPFKVALKEDDWSTRIDHLEHYTRFTLTFQEIV